MHYAALIGAMMCTVTAQLALKISTQKVTDHRLFGIVSPVALFSYSCFLGSTLLSLFALQRVPLKLFTACSAANYPLVAIGSALLLKESVQGRSWIALGIIVLGVVLISWP